MALSKNQEIQLNIEDCASNGSGVGKYGRMTVFVPGAAAGDTVTAHIIKVKKNYAVAKIKDIITPSAHRVEADCERFPSCGGCAFRHISYDEEKKITQRWVKEAFKRIGHIDLPVNPLVSCGSQRYRNKAQYPVGTDSKGGIIAGFYAQKSHRIVNCGDCLLQPAEFAGIVTAVKDWMSNNGVPAYDSETGRGLVRHIYIRKGFETGEICVCLVINGTEIPFEKKLVSALSKTEGVKSIVLNENRENSNVVLGRKCVTLWGRDYIEDILCGVRVKLSPLSFYQVNRGCAELLYGQAAKYAAVTGRETVLDLYCGAGTIGLSLAKSVKRVIGVEIVEDAVRDAAENARLNGIENAGFYCADAAEAVRMLRDKNIKPDTVILDPPRKGCDSSVLSCIAEMGAQKVVYVSCDVSTQARDCAVLREYGYTAVEATPFDMFPRTAHVECAALLEK